MKSDTVIITAANAARYGAIEHWHRSYCVLGVPLLVYDIGLTKRQKTALAASGIEVVPFEVPLLISRLRLPVMLSKAAVISHCAATNAYQRIVWTDVETVCTADMLAPQFADTGDGPLLFKDADSAPRDYQALADLCGLDLGHFAANSASSIVAGFNTGRERDRLLLYWWSNVTQQLTEAQSSNALRPKADRVHDYISYTACDCLRAALCHVSDPGERWAADADFAPLDADDRLGRYLGREHFLDFLLKEHPDKVLYFSAKLGRHYWQYFERPQPVVATERLYDTETSPTGDFRWLAARTTFKIVGQQRIQFSFGTVAHAAKALTVSVNGRSSEYAFNDAASLECIFELDSVSEILISAEAHVPRDLFDGTEDCRELSVMLLRVSVARTVKDDYRPIDLRSLDEEIF